MATNHDLDIFIDDMEKDLRTVYRVDFRLMRVEIARLNGYDEEKHCWQNELSRAQKEIPNKRGFKKLSAWITDLNLKHYGYPHPRLASYYFTDGVRTHY
tara:strand:+ start:434 stop:730 length:297 start_codon:yes stop_codon:yes gene_type:complete